jgi:hypothetical protein
MLHKIREQGMSADEAALFSLVQQFEVLQEYMDCWESECIRAVETNSALSAAMAEDLNWFFFMAYNNIQRTQGLPAPNREDVLLP